MAEPIWSLSQRAIFAYFGRDILALSSILRELGLEITVDADGHLIVRARAGTGKTTTILNGIRYATEDSILLCAFNKDIATELKMRAPQFNRNAVAKTLHGVGYSQIREFMSGLHVDDKARSRYLTDAVVGSDLRLPLDVLRIVTKLHKLGRETMPLAQGPADLLDLAYDQDCEPDEKWKPYGYTVDFVAGLAYKAMVHAAEDMDAIKRTGIDYADMLYLPIRNKWMAGLHDLVVVDEAQDMTGAQLMLARGICRTGGRIVIVGDDRQAIYGFRGADSEALDRLKLELNASELGLTTTYRCGRKITEFAASLVPDFRSGAEYDGAITYLNGIQALAADVAPGDFILSRKNAPLASIVLKLLLAGKRAYIRGRSFGDKLIKVVERVGKRSDGTIEDFLARLDAWRDKEIAKALAEDKEERVDGIRDEAATISALAEGMVTIPELIARLHALFQDDGTGDAGRVTLSSIHKAKGLEADRVFVLVDTLFPRLPRKLMTPAREKEEANLAYVAYSRAKHALALVRTENVPDPPPAATVTPISTQIHTEAQAQALVVLPASPEVTDMLATDLDSVIPQLVPGILELSRGPKE